MLLLLHSPLTEENKEDDIITEGGLGSKPAWDPKQLCLPVWQQHQRCLQQGDVGQMDEMKQLMYVNINKKVRG